MTRVAAAVVGYHAAITNSAANMILHRLQGFLGDQVLVEQLELLVLHPDPMLRELAMLFQDINQIPSLWLPKACGRGFCFVFADA